MNTMPTVSIYDPPQCCATGACGPDADDELAQFASALEWLKTEGVEVQRFNLGHQPGEFVQNPTVKSTLDSEGMDCLPLVIIDGTVARKGGYMTRAELGASLGLAVTESVTASAGGSCCGGA
jgi:hypothetical protein